VTERLEAAIEAVLVPSRDLRLAADARPTIEDVYRMDAPRFRRVAQAILHDGDAAQEVVQEAFATALVRRGSFRGSGDLAAWVWRIVVNKAVSARRRRQLEALVVQRGRPVAAPAADASGEDARLRQSIARLPERQKVALFLRYYADLDYETIGVVLSVAPGTVGKLLHDARAAIRRALEEHEDA